ncbi:MAG: hypothetical protein JXR10_02290 [Cyclobacteriaceae bacterium]
MKNLIICLGLFFSFSAWSQDSSEILKKHFEDYGQQDWNEVRTLTIDGFLKDSHFGRWPMQLIRKGPEKVKIVGKYQGKQYAEAFDGQDAWIKAPWKGRYEVERMNAEEELIIRNSFSFGSPLYSIKEHLKFKGLMDKEGTLYFAYMMDEGSYQHTFFIGRDDYRLYYEEITTKFGTPITILKVVEKYKNYGTMLVPTAVIFEGDELDKELTFDEVYIGMGVKDYIFTMPKGQ